MQSNSATVSPKIIAQNYFHVELEFSLMLFSNHETETAETASFDT